MTKDLFGEDREARRSDLADFSMVLHAKTGKALRLSESGDIAAAKWVPLSLVEVNEDRCPLAEARTGDMIEIALPEWAAKDRGWI